MRYDHEELQDLLAAQYVLGSLRGAARSRFAALLLRDAALRRRVERWEAHLFPLLLGAPRVEPPPRVWRAIRARIAAPRRVPEWRRWPRLALAGLAAALALLLYFGLAPPRPAPYTMVALLNDRQAQPALLVSWTPKQAAQRRLSVRILVEHPQMPAGTSWQAWLLTGADAAPIPLGLIGAARQQVLELSPRAAAALPRATALGVSVEPEGGSVGGGPSGPYLLQGPALRIDEQG